MERDIHSLKSVVIVQMTSWLLAARVTRWHRLTRQQRRQAAGDASEDGEGEEELVVSGVWNSEIVAFLYKNTRMVDFHRNICVNRERESRTRLDST